MTRRAPYFHVYIGLMMVFASYAMGVTMRVREARLNQSERRCWPSPPPRVEKTAFATSGVCSVEILEMSCPKPDVEKPIRDTLPNGMRISQDGNTAFYIAETTGFLIEDGNVLIHCDWSLASHVSDTKNWKVSLTARFPGLAGSFKLKVEKYSKENCIALCSFAQPDDVEIPNPLLQGIAQLPSDGQRLLVAGYPENGEIRVKSPAPLTTPAAIGKVYSAEACHLKDSLISLDGKDWYKVGLGALVLNEQKQVVGILSLEPPGFCGYRGRHVFPLNDVLKNLEDVADPFDIRQNSPPVPSEHSSSTR
jgi:hypothetical protein